MTDQEKPKNTKPKDNPLMNILINVLIPVFALSIMSKDGGKPWQIGPVWGMTIAVCFPLFYGLYDLIKNRKLNVFSVIGVVSVLFTGGLTVYLWNEDGTVKPDAPLFFAIKEATMPLILGIVILLSHRTSSPLVRVFLYNPDLFDVPRIEKAVDENGHRERYESCLYRTTLIMAGSFLLSSVMNFFLAMHFLKDTGASREAYNAGVGRLTWWGFIVIGAPCLVIWGIALWRLIKDLKQMTSLDTEEMMVPR